MSLEIQAVSDKIICEVVKHEAISPGGLILPDSEHSSIQPKKDYVVISIGDKVENVKIGDFILCHERSGMDHMFEGKVYKIVKYEELYGIVTEVK